MQLLIPPPLPTWFSILLLLIVLPAAVYDFRFRRIPNWIAVTGFILGLIANCADTGFSGLKQSLSGFGIAFGIYLIFYLLHAMGAGDVKLMGALGAIAGVRWWIWIFMTTGVISAVLAVILALSKGRLRSTFWNVGYIVRELLSFRVPWMTRKDLDVKNPDTLRLPHAISIAIGTILSLAFSYLRD